MVVLDVYRYGESFVRKVLNGSQLAKMKKEIFNMGPAIKFIGKKQLV